MQREQIVFVASDLSGHFRGKSFPAADLAARLTFCPIPQPNGTGNETHIHGSFKDPGHPPLLYDERKRAEVAGLTDLDEEEICGRYAEAH